MLNRKRPAAIAAILLLVAVLMISGCSAETKAELSNWFNKSLSACTIWDMLVVVFFGSLVANMFK